MPFTDVGFRTTALTSSLSLEHKMSYYVLVRATDAANLSSIGSSVAFFVDTTPPYAFECKEYGSNALDTSNFTALDQASFDNQWSIQGTVDIQDSSIILKGSMEQNITLTKNQMYIADIYGHLPCIGERPKLKIGSVEADITFDISTEGLCHYDISFISQENVTTIFKVSTIENMTLTSASLRMCDDKRIVPDNDIKNAVSISSTNPSGLSIAWSVNDEESGIRNFEVAVGSKPGGSQFMVFSNNGHMNQIAVNNLDLYHKATVYATISAYNRAGNLLRITSNPLEIDWTPPHLPVPIAVAVPTGSLTSTGAMFRIQVNWAGQIDDPDSGIESCSYGLGNYYYYYYYYYYYHYYY